jgi:hypothetical protein
MRARKPRFETLGMTRHQAKDWAEVLDYQQWSQRSESSPRCYHFNPGERRKSFGDSMGGRETSNALLA